MARTKGKNATSTLQAVARDCTRTFRNPTKAALKNCIYNELAIRGERRISDAQVTATADRIGAAHGLSGRKRRRR